MDLRAYYKKIREIETSIDEPYIVLISQETPEGGKPGVRTQVPRHIASKLILEGRARVATSQEAANFQEENAEAKRIADQLAAANRMQVVVVPANELRNMKTAGRNSKEQG